MSILVDVLGDDAEYDPLPAPPGWKERAQKIVLQELEQGREKSRDLLVDLIQARTGMSYSSSSVWKYVLQPLREQGAITCHKKGMEGGWVWRLALREQV